MRAAAGHFHRVHSPRVIPVSRQLRRDIRVPPCPAADAVSMDSRHEADDPPPGRPSSAVSSARAERIPGSLARPSRTSGSCRATLCAHSRARGMWQAHGLLLGSSYARSRRRGTGLPHVRCHERSLRAEGTGSRRLWILGIDRRPRSHGDSRGREPSRTSDRLDREGEAAISGSPGGHCWR